MTDLERMRKDNGGTLPAFVWPGGYTIVYIMQDGETMCAACANGENGSEARLSDSPDDAPRDGWRIDGYGIRGGAEDAEWCCHCNKELE